MERKAAQLRAELEVHRDALAAANMEVALLGEQLVQSQGRVQVGPALLHSTCPFVNGNSKGSSSLGFPSFLPSLGFVDCLSPCE